MPENEIRRIIKEEMYNFIEDAYTKLKNYSIFSDDGDNSPRPYTITDVFEEWLKEYKMAKDKSVRPQIHKENNND